MYSTLDLLHTLPCGHELRIKLFDEEGDAEGNWITKAAGNLQYWQASRALYHDCSLVSEENPNGFTRTKKEVTQWQEPQQ